MVVTNDSGCEATSTVKVINGSGIKVFIDGPTSMCSGQTAILSTIVSGGTGTYIYQWQNNGVNIEGATAKTLSVTEAGSYSVNVSDNKGCSAVSEAKNLKEVNQSTASITSSTGSDMYIPGRELILSIIPSPGQLYQWSRNEQLINGAVTNAYTVTQEGSYTISVTSNGCTIVSAPFVVSIILSVKPILQDGYRLAVFPNPVISDVKATFSAPKPVRPDIVIYDLNGQKWVEKSSGVNLQNHEIILDLSKLPSGMYLIQAKTSSTGMELVNRIFKR